MKIKIGKHKIEEAQLMKEIVARISPETFERIIKKIKKDFDRGVLPMESYGIRG